MPTVLRIDGFRFFFYSNENGEPAHIHIQHGDALAKYWLAPVSLASSYGFKAQELKKLAKLVEQNKGLFQEKWDEFFSA